MLFPPLAEIEIMKRERPEIRILLNPQKHTDILAWAEQQVSVSESVIALIRTHLTLSENDALREIAAGVKRIEKQLSQGIAVNAQTAAPEEQDPELLDALAALG